MRETAIDLRYAIVIETAENNHSAYVPDLPGRVAKGATIAEGESEIREAISFLVEGLLEDGLPFPPALSQVEYVEVEALASCQIVGWNYERFSSISVHASTFGGAELRSAPLRLARGCRLSSTRQIDKS